MLLAATIIINSECAKEGNALHASYDVLCAQADDGMWPQQVCYTHVGVYECVCDNIIRRQADS